MGISIETYALSKTYTDKTVMGAGAIKGKNCTIDSITDIPETISKPAGKEVTFKWTLDDGTEQTDTMDVYNGQDGKGIDRIYIDVNDHFIVVYDDGTEEDCGEVVVYSSVDSVNGKTGVVELVLNDIANIGTNLSYDSVTNTLSANDQKSVLTYATESAFPAQGEVDKLYVAKTNGKAYIWNIISNEYTFSGSYCTINNIGGPETPITMEATITSWYYQGAPAGTWIGFQNNSYQGTEPPYIGVAFDAIMTKIGKTSPIEGDKVTFYKYNGVTSITYNSEGTDYDISDCLYVASGATYGHDLYIVANANQEFSGIMGGPGSAIYRGYQNLQEYRLVKTEVDWSEILNKPAFGTASSKDAPESGDATNVQVVMGNDSRLTNARPPIAHIHDKTDINDFAWFDDHIYTSYEDLLLNSKMELGGFYKVTENNGTKRSYYVVENKNKPNDVEYNIHNNRKNYVYISNTQATGHTDKPVIFVYRPNIESEYNEFNISSAVIDIIFTANTSSYTPQKHFLINCALIKSISGISTLKKNESIIIYTGDKKAILVKEDGTKIDISGAILDSYVIAGATLTTETFYLRTDNTGTTQGFSNVQDIAVQDLGSSEDHYYIEIAEIYSGNLSDGDIFDYQYKELINSIDQTSELTLKQPKTLDTPITISGITYTTVESVLGALNSGAVGNGVEIVSQLPSASVDTMEKLYILMAANLDPELYVTTVSNNVYAWFKLSGSDVEEITISEAHDDFEAVFGSGTTGNPNINMALASSFDYETYSDTIYEGTPTDKSTYISGDTYDFDYSNCERLKITGCNCNVAQGVDGRWKLPGDIAVIDNPQEGDTFIIKSNGGAHEQGTYVFTSTGIRRTKNVWNQCGIFSIISYHPNVIVDSI